MDAPAVKASHEKDKKKHNREIKRAVEQEI